MATAGLILMFVGLFCLAVGAIGVIRLPDVFTRAQAISLMDSVGALFLFGGLALYGGLSSYSVRVLLVLGLLYLVNPTITHATLRAASRAGVEPWSKDRQ